VMSPAVKKVELASYNFENQSLTLAHSWVPFDFIERRSDLNGLELTFAIQDVKPPCLISDEIKPGQFASVSTKPKA